MLPSPRRTLSLPAILAEMDADASVEAQVEACTLLRLACAEPLAGALADGSPSVAAMVREIVAHLLKALESVGDSDNISRDVPLVLAALIGSQKRAMLTAVPDVLQSFLTCWQKFSRHSSLRVGLAEVIHSVAALFEEDEQWRSAFLASVPHFISLPELIAVGHAQGRNLPVTFCSAVNTLASFPECVAELKRGGVLGYLERLMHAYRALPYYDESLSADVAPHVREIREMLA